MRFSNQQGPAIRYQLFSRNLAILLFAQAVAVTGWFAVVTAGGILGRSLAANPALATLPVSLLIVGTAVSTVIASWTMARVGRARGFAIGATVGAFGAACAFVATLTGAFPISRSRAHTHRRHGHPLQTVPSAGLIERPQEKNRVDALR